MNIEKCKLFIKSMKEDNVSEYAAQCSYYTILSFIPFVILILTLIQYTGIEPQVLFSAISKVIPSNMSEIVLNIVQEVYSKSIGTISISIIFVLWSAGKGLFAFTKGLQAIYKTSDAKNASYMYMRVKAILETIIFIALIVIGLVALMFGEVFKNILKKHFGIIQNYKVLIVNISLIFVIFIIFLLCYKFIPRHKVPLKSQIMGALFSSIALSIISYVFSQYLYIFEGFSLMYGSLTTLMLIMMWTYTCFYIMLLGAELNKLINN